MNEHGERHGGSEPDGPVSDVGPSDADAPGGTPGGRAARADVTPPDAPCRPDAPARPADGARTDVSGADASVATPGARSGSGGPTGAPDAVTGAGGTSATEGTEPGSADGPYPRSGSAVVGAEPADGAGDELGATVAALTADDIAPARRRQLLTRLVGQARRRGLADLFKPRAALRWMTDTVADVAPHIPVRDLATLRRHFPGLDDEALADRLVRNATRATAGVGAAGGGVAAVEWTVAPTLLSAPVLLAAETVAVVSIELKLIGELHEVYGAPLPTGGTPGPSPWSSPGPASGESTRWCRASG